MSGPRTLSEDGVAEPEPAVFQPEITLAPFPGYVDFLGYCNVAGGWFFSGWTPRTSAMDNSASAEFLAHFELSQTEGEATLVFYQRADLDHKAIGVVAYVPAGGGRSNGPLQHAMFVLDGVKYQMQAGHGTQILNDEIIVERVRSILTHQSPISRNREYLLAITRRRGYSGQDTLAALSDPVLIEIDLAIFCPPSGVLLKGWLLAALGTIRKILVRSGPLSGELRLKDSLMMPRPDVISAVGQKMGFTDDGCGFISYVPGAISLGETAYLEIEIDGGEVGFRKIAISKLSGLDAIRRILDDVHVRYAELDSAFDNVLGPAVASLNDARLRVPVTASQITFGEVPLLPTSSLVIPLFGRVDFIEYQMALFSRNPAVRDVEIIYVLDDPSKRRELEPLARSIFERFSIPFHLLLLPQNLGFAGANNVGLRAARGDFVCFLNSDVFPITENWLERLVGRLEMNPELGVVGARLLFEDGSIQHEGCFFRDIPEFGNWAFVDHFNKGRRPDDRTDLRRCEVITGACMVMRRTLAAELGGFDERYVVGDFEDADVCRKVTALGLFSAVDNDVHLYHLERKSQTGPGQNWRMNLTLYNAWLHQRRWLNDHPNTNDE
jgi:GT2 family glycosyltransferase